MNISRYVKSDSRYLKMRRNRLSENLIKGLETLDILREKVGVLESNYAYEPTRVNVNNLKYVKVGHYNNKNILNIHNELIELTESITELIKDNKPIKEIFDKINDTEIKLIDKIIDKEKDKYEFLVTCSFKMEKENVNLIMNIYDNDKKSHSFIYYTSNDIDQVYAFFELLDELSDEIGKLYDDYYPKEIDITLYEKFEFKQMLYYIAIKYLQYKSKSKIKNKRNLDVVIESVLVDKIKNISFFNNFNKIKSFVDIENSRYLFPTIHLFKYWFKKEYDDFFEDGNYDIAYVAYEKTKNDYDLTNIYKDYFMYLRWNREFDLLLLNIGYQEGNHLEFSIDIDNKQNDFSVKNYLINNNYNLYAIDSPYPIENLADDFIVDKMENFISGSTENRIILYTCDQKGDFNFKSEKTENSYMIYICTIIDYLNFIVQLILLDENYENYNKISFNQKNLKRIESSWATVINIDDDKNDDNLFFLNSVEQKKLDNMKKSDDKRSSKKRKRDSETKNKNGNKRIRKIEKKLTNSERDTIKKFIENDKKIINDKKFASEVIVLIKQYDKEISKISTGRKFEEKQDYLNNNMEYVFSLYKKYF